MEDFRHAPLSALMFARADRADLSFEDLADRATISNTDVGPAAGGSSHVGRPPKVEPRCRLTLNDGQRPTAFTCCHPDRRPVPASATRPSSATPSAHRGCPYLVVPMNASGQSSPDQRTDICEQTADIRNGDSHRARRSASILSCQMRRPMADPAATCSQAWNAPGCTCNSVATFAPNRRRA